MTYKEIKNKILETINNDDVIYDGNFISAYDLIKIINQEFGPIEYVINNKELYKSMFNLPKCKILKNTLTNFGVKLLYIDIGYEKIMFVFGKDYHDNFGYFSVSKNEFGNLIDTNYEYNCDIIKRDFKNEFIRLNEKLINEIITIMINLRKKYDLHINYGNNNLIFSKDMIVSNDKFYCISEIENDVFSQQYKIFLWNEIGLTQEEREKISKFFDDNMDVLIRKIKVNINSLKKIYQQAIGAYYNKKNDKVLRKKY